MIFLQDSSLNDKCTVIIHLYTKDFPSCGWETCDSCGWETCDNLCECGFRTYIFLTKILVYGQFKNKYN